MRTLPKSEPATGASVGLSITRGDTIGQVTGEMAYVEDLKVPGMLHAKVMRSAHAHARILKVDTRLAASSTGVRAVATAVDIPVNRFGPTFQDQPVIAGEKVRHLGDAVAAVAAESEREAEAALHKFRVEYDPLPGVFDPLRSMEADAPRIHGEKSNVYAEWHIEKGDVERALARSHQVIQGWAGVAYEKVSQEKTALH